MKELLMIAGVLLSGGTGLAQSLDVTKYDVVIRLSDSSDVIEVTEHIHLMPLNGDEVQLDLQSQNAKGVGMKIQHVRNHGKDVPFTHENDRLAFKVGVTSSQDIEVKFSGIPEDGLVIGSNRYGNRTFFGDNWPNRAHQWFACNDHPSDKAQVAFSVIAPDHYQVVSNGKLIGEVPYAGGLKLTSYASEHELPTKVMVIGVADFSIQNLSQFERFPLSSWVYPENEKAGFYDMEQAIEILNFLEEKIAPYPYEKLANVQSTTRYGGMENAGCIFYAENAITGKRSMEELIAHEIAHQWFGNSASETDWDHLWLSEGFATFLTNVYLEQKYGHERYMDELNKDRRTVANFYRMVQLPVVDTLTIDPMSQLNTNAYQRGGWVLHMLRNELGDELFWKGIRAYYQEYKYSNASTDDFITVMERESGKDLSEFDAQWLRCGELPELQLSQKVKGKRLDLQLEQRQNVIFHLPVVIRIDYEDGSSERLEVDLKHKFYETSLRIKAKVKRIYLDPDTAILFVN